MKRPPYSREVETILQTGREPNVWLFAGPDAWDKAKECRRTHGRGSALLLPPGDDPAGYCWPPVDGLMLIADADGEITRELVRAVLAAGVRVVIELRLGQAVYHYRQG